MSGTPVELILLWHHHQPEYRRPSDGASVLPWVRLHASKDYLDMALRLERHPGVRCTFNFAPSLLDQLDAAASGGVDLLFQRLARPAAELTAEDRAELLRRCGQAPRHAFERWPAYRTLLERLRRGTRSAASASADRDLVRLIAWFLLAWVDPMFLDEPEAREALAAGPELSEAHRQGLLALHERLVGRVIPAYRTLAEQGRIEIAASPYYHPILPLLVDTKSARRARPAMALPREPFAAPEDARRQIEQGRVRAAAAFGRAPEGMWPSEGSVSPEAALLAAECGVRWLASDEGVLWQSLDPDARRRESLYRPWRFVGEAGEVAMLFRDRELSDRIGFVYQNWRAEEAVADFVERVRRVPRDPSDPRPPVVSVILDGENCWEHYPDDGGPFLEALYAALDKSSDIVTRTPSQVVGRAAELPALPRLHSGSWIDADFHIWIGHPEKNRAWDLLARTRRAMLESGATSEQAPQAWEALYAAEGSDWFWWFGEDHFTPDKSLFDSLFRLQLRAAHERAGLLPPAALDVAIAGITAEERLERVPLGPVRPVIDGRRTTFYEWHGAGRYRMRAGGAAMHQAARLTSDFYFGFDVQRLYLRVDFADGRPPGEDCAFLVELAAPQPSRLGVASLGPGDRPVAWWGGPRDGQGVEGAKCAVGGLLELAIPFASLGLESGATVELVARLVRGGQPIETLPADEVLQFLVPGPDEGARQWSA